MKRVDLLCIAMLFLCGAVYAERTVWYVHPDSALNTIQAGLDSCADYDIVLVGLGTYYENIIWPNTQGIRLISEMGPELTIIDGDSASNSDSASVVALLGGQDTNTVLMGFTITNGSGTYDPTWLGHFGGGIFCRNNSSPTIMGNIITGNTTTYGGGIECDYSCSPIIKRNTIINNAVDSIGGGIDLYKHCSALIMDNLISQNTARWGAGISCDDSCSPVITGNTINGNNCSYHGGGIGFFNQCSLVIKSNTITGNTAVRGGGIFCYRSHAIIDSNEITENTTTFSGGGIRCYQSSPEITNNNISGNTASAGAGIASYQWSAPLIKNNNIIGNHARVAGGGIDNYGNSSARICDNIISDNTADSLGLGAGICCWNNAVPFIDSCDITFNNGDGITCHYSSSPEIHYNDIYGNSNYGIRNLDSTVIVDAENNWWGDSTGPYHPDSNPGGLGDTVSDYVDFIPWLYWPGVEEQMSIPNVVTRLEIYPNPFRSKVNIAYTTVNGAGCKDLTIYDAVGRLIKDLTSYQSPYNQVTWDGTDERGKKVSSGVYFIKFKAENYRETKKLLLIR